MIKVRKAKQSEMDWVNVRYDEVSFVHSNFDKEIIAIAEVNNQRAGIGRLVNVNSNCLELGGMYVFEAFRNLGVARKIVEFLLQHILPSQCVYCIPFQHLDHFYRQFGFAPCEISDTIPDELLQKYQWCKEQYSQPTTLLMLQA